MPTDSPQIVPAEVILTMAGKVERVDEKVDNIEDKVDQLLALRAEDEKRIRSLEKFRNGVSAVGAFLLAVAIPAFYEWSPWR